MLVFEQSTENVPPKLTNEAIVYPSLGDVTNNVYFDCIYSIALNTDLLGYLINKEKIHKFLSKNIDVFITIPDTVHKVNDAISTKITPDLEIVNDEEFSDQERLALVFRIKNKSYQEILDMWNVVSKKVYADLDDSISKKIAIILDGE